MSATTRVTGPSGRTIEVAEGTRLVFGRGADADLMLPGDRGLSRRAGVVTALRDGAWVANMSCTHALYVETDGHRIRLPRLRDGEEPTGGWFMRCGTALVGSGAMLDDGQPLRVVVIPREPDIDLRAEHSGPGVKGQKGDTTLLPLYLDPMTKLFLVALLWCRPWLVDPSRTTPLPRTPEIARAALEVTDASYELERFATDPAFRDRLSARVGEHIKVLRRKIIGRGLARAGSRLSDEVVVGVLLEHEIITLTDLARLDDPVWCSRQEDLWWSGMP
ncbi:FHA domain-containing protein [Sphaerisporangium sp. B11E5]|uniref:FHA domain-containing protein n=1 Tax=Sphaerisporangium sp. B11E5 TaxID=3153563 RepID=UPI00325C3D7F